MRRLSASFVLGYPGCDREIGERLAGEALRGLAFAEEAARRHGSKSAREAHDELMLAMRNTGWPKLRNSGDGLRRKLDCAVMVKLHDRLRGSGQSPIDTIKAVVIEGSPIYPTAGFYEKTHTQIAVCNPECIRGVFRVSRRHLR